MRQTQRPTRSRFPARGPSLRSRRALSWGGAGPLAHRGPLCPLPGPGCVYSASVNRRCPEARSAVTTSEKHVLSFLRRLGGSPTTRGFPGARQAGLQDGRAGARLVPPGFDGHAEAQGGGGGSRPRNTGKDLARRAQPRVPSPAGADVGASTCPPHTGHRTRRTWKSAPPPPVGGSGEG